ncbi:MAG: 16S rRNA (guanine(527)-N(7))-methyltransferase RsmG [Planctomycetes bacterium]|nr:16S rRNA (guanine(527)-N(7))-methyltransferase RsmG [Planctomycetota bacterium]MCW8137151.1 16S rRNA (guanine(527)-N(7))-methyltransferase RsmG [Planctomycetota bacterium]
MRDENRQLLVAGLAEIGLAVPQDRVERLIGYHDFLLETNAQFNLTGYRDERESVINNLLNSLAPHKHVLPLSSTADVGTGGGMPGLPLAIALGMPKVALIESKRKKCEFLKAACERFAPQVDVLHADVNTVTRKFVQIVSSAYGSLEKLLSGTSRMRAPGCRLLAWKGRRETIDAEIAACLPAQREWAVVPFAVPGLPDTQRHLCIHTTAARRKPAA